MTVDMKKLYASGLMTDFGVELEAKVKLTLNDGTQDTEIEFKVKFLAMEEYLTEPEEVEEIVEEEEEKKDDTPAFVPVYNVDRIPKKNAPVEVADASTPPEERTSPQIGGMGIDADGIAFVTFSKPMTYPINWVEKYKSDSGNDVDEAMQDTIVTPLFTFWFEFITTNL